MAHPRKKPVSPGSRLRPLSAAEAKVVSLPVEPPLPGTLTAWSCGHCEASNEGHHRQCQACQAPLPIIALFTAHTYYQADRTSIRIRWEVAEAESLFLEPGHTPLPAKGYVDINPEFEPSRSFQLVATNRTGTSRLQAQVSEIKPRIRTFSASEATIQVGHPIILSWEVENAAAVRLQHPSGEIDLSDVSFYELFCEESTTCTLIASNPMGSVSRVLRLTLPPPQIQSFHATQDHIRSGDPVQLFWEASNVTRAWLTDSHGDRREVSPSGPCTVRPEQTTTYTLRVENPSGQAEASCTLTLPPPRIVRFEANAPISAEGEALT
ncbi:MAG: hypothetical protein D6722_28205, partial [Bacteroidetes bacterium]